VLERIRGARLWREPTLHFFVLAAALLLGHRLVAGNPRTIVITAAQQADLLRRYQDQLNRAPTRAEADAFLAAWKGDEALYREALREGIDRDDPTVRTVLIGKMRERLMLQTRLPEPTEADLRQYLGQHRDEFETPLMYEHQIVVFPRSDPAASQKRAQVERRLAAGATVASLGLRSIAANVTRDRIEQDFGPAVAEQICRLPIGPWRQLETADRLLLVQMIGVQGGLPPPEILHARLVAAWKAQLEQQALARATRAVAARYRYEEPSR
jgi:hypothetical protein